MWKVHLPLSSRRQTHWKLVGELSALVIHFLSGLRELCHDLGVGVLLVQAVRDGERSRPSRDTEPSRLQEDHPRVALLTLMLLQLLHDLLLRHVEGERDHGTGVTVLELNARAELFEAVEVEHQAFSVVSVCAACVSRGWFFGFCSGSIP